ncbi:GTPase ObgE [Fontisphaera persica]|uniref:Obg family GTPase n=1 Tax=Fontisphaera persica TaxID=2974023 RepID=UPI0024C05C76|nr:GTPase ObgE [Fontisphaera persica]WCJ59836.1 GTPase ObgE [Fontisphaera persica]
MFIDEIKVYARGGHGGRGCVAFHREAYRPKGGPSGGNGGRGGSVILEADHDLNNLIAQYYQPRLIAQNGQHGMGKGMDGASGKDLIVKVPCGTLVWRLPRPDQPAKEPELTPPTDKPILASSLQHRPVIRVSRGEAALEIDLAAEEESPEPQTSDPQKGELIADLTQHGQRFVLCRGGRGGLGNRAFATSTRQTPRFAQPGEPGEEGEFLLELRIMADVGLVGYPNAGKSTLLSAISKARPKIAPYPFTTLTPQVGIVEYEDFHRLTVCDVPGLIAGAHRNVGLGHAFLRHLQRCKVLVLLLDMAGTDGRLPWEDYHTLLVELELFDPSLLERTRLVVANKMDEPAAAGLLKQFKRQVRRVPVLTISAAFGDGLEVFKRALRQAVETTA